MPPIPLWDDAEWRQWGDDMRRRDVHTRAGHTEHCAKRQVWGDGACECGADFIMPLKRIGVINCMLTGVRKLEFSSLPGEFE